MQLNNDVAASAAPGNLAAAAAALGMVPAGNPAFLVIGADGMVRVLGSPAPASARRSYVAPTKSKAPKTKPTKTAGHGDQDRRPRTTTDRRRRRRQTPARHAKTTPGQASSTDTDADAAPRRRHPTRRRPLPGGDR